MRQVAGETAMPTLYTRLEQLLQVLISAQAHLDELERIGPIPAAGAPELPAPDLRQLIEMCIDTAERLENRAANIKSQLGRL